MRVQRWFGVSILSTALLGAVVALAPTPAAACELDTPADFVGYCDNHSFIGPVQIGFLGLWAIAPENFLGLSQLALKTYTGKRFYGLAQAGLSNDTGGRFIGLAQVGIGNNMGIGIRRKTYDRKFLFNTFDIFEYEYEPTIGTEYGFALVQAGLVFNTCGHCSFLQATLVANQALEIDGIQLAGIYNEAEVVKGIQSGFLYNHATDIFGIQSAPFATAERIHGLQVGVINLTDRVTGVQLGIYNQARKLAGVQIGLMNIVTENVGLPWMLLINLGFES